MLTPQQIKHITDNLNALVERSNYDVKVTFEHKLWWLGGLSAGISGMDVEASLINVDNDEEGGDMYSVDEQELQSMALEVLAQVSLGA